MVEKTRFIPIDKPTKELEWISADFAFFCPGCNILHGVWTTNRNGNNAIWQFNNDLNNPTVSPSILVRYRKQTGDVVCHSFVKNGMIEFLPDCTHELAGKTVELKAL